MTARDDAPAAIPVTELRNLTKHLRPLEPVESAALIHFVGAASRRLRLGGAQLQETPPLSEALAAAVREAVVAQFAATDARLTAQVDRAHGLRRDMIAVVESRLAVRLAHIEAALAARPHRALVWSLVAFAASGWMTVAMIALWRFVLTA